MRPEILEERSVATTKFGLERVLEECVGSVVLIDVGTHSPWFSRML
jgi:hypothetical protein